MNTPRSLFISPERRAFLFAPLALLWCVVVSLPVPAVCGADTFEGTGSLVHARAFHTATLLANGKVLVAGGNEEGTGFPGPLSTAELYTRSTPGVLGEYGSWGLADYLNNARTGHTATLLTSGKVLIAGGRAPVGTRDHLSSAELYDPASATWNVTGSMAGARIDHTATLLPNGKVLVAGGQGPGFGPFGRSLGTFASAELYDPASGKWSATGSMTNARNSHTATLLPNGKVLVAGGYFDRSAELYDPATGKWSATGSLAHERVAPTATLLLNGKVLIAGGYRPPGDFDYLSTAELYDPATGKWSATGSMKKARDGHTATLLPTGKVLVAGGSGPPGTTDCLSSAELYEPASGTWSATSSMADARAAHTATLLPNGKVLIAGGYRPGELLASAELFEPEFAIGTWAERTVERSLPTTVGSVVDIGTLTFKGGTGTIEASFNASGPGWTVAKHYLIPMRKNLGNGSPPATWLKVLPTHDTGPSGGNNFDLDVNVSGATAQLRLRSLGSNGGTPKVRIAIKTAGLKTFVDANPPIIIIGPPTTVAAPAETVAGNALNERNGKAGVGVAPSANAVIDVDGGDTRGLHLHPRSTLGAPATGTWHRGTIILDSGADLYICTAPGTPGTWKKVGN